MNPTFNPAIDIKESVEMNSNVNFAVEHPDEPATNEYPMGPPVWGTTCTIA